MYSNHRFLYKKNLNETKISFSIEFQLNENMKNNQCLDIEIHLNDGPVQTSRKSNQNEAVR